MEKITCLKEVAKVGKYPKEVVEAVSKSAQILDEEYGSERDNEGLGGYILVVETEEELEELKSHNIYADEDIAEYVEAILVDGEIAFTNSLILLGSDFAVILIIPINITPKNLIMQM